MNSFLSLTKSFIKSLSMSDATGFRRILFRFLLCVVFFFIFLPFVLGVGILTYSMTVSLMEVDFETVGLSLLLILLSFFIFIFSFNVILNELYFNDNIEHILPLPLKPYEVVASKFSACFMAENIMSFLIVFFGVGGYLVARGFKWSSFLLGLVGVVTLPIIPMVYTGIICLFLMYFTKFIRNKESVKQFSMLLVFGVLCVFVFSISSLRQFDFDLFIEGMALGNRRFLNVMNVIFPHINLFIDTINNNSIFSLLLYLLVNAFFVGIYLLLSNKFYFDGVMGLISKDTKKKKTSTTLLNNIYRKTPVISYISKELKILFRTPSYFINCITINIIWPIFVYAIYKILNLGSIRDIGLHINSFDNKTMIIYFLFILGISIMVPCISTISSSSFSREGKHYDFIKYIPLSFNKILFSKIFVAFIISFIGIIFYLFIFAIMSRMRFSVFLLSLLFIIISVLVISILGVLIDSIQPKLVWDDELNALRENYNTFIVMGISLLIMIIILLFGLYYIDRNISYINFFIFNSVLLLILAFILLVLIKIFGVKNLQDQEEL